MNEGGVKTSRHYQVESAIKRGDVIEVKPEALEVYKEVFGAKSKEVGNVKGVDNGQAAKEQLQVAAKGEASRLMREARVEEPGMSKAIEDIAKQTDGKLVGLEHRFKSEESLTRKLADRAERSVIKQMRKGVNQEEAILNSIKEHAIDINDTVRYTLTFSMDKYTIGYQNTIKTLQNQGYKIEGIWNAWEMVGTPQDTGYRGINVTVVNPNGQKFELQFHTPQSYQVKTDSHILYEERRLATTSAKRKQDLKRLQIEKAKTIPVPHGIITGEKK
jgi:hypothetical protein